MTIEALKRKATLVGLINMWNEAPLSSVARTDTMDSIERDYRFGIDYMELSTGVLWAIPDPQRAKYIERVSLGLIGGATLEEQFEAILTWGELRTPKVDPIAPKVKAAGAC